MTHCPTCGQKIVKAARRACADCGKPIAGRHKWFFGDDGRARHRICEEPDAYTRATAKPAPTLPLGLDPRVNISVSEDLV